MEGETIGDEGLAGDSAQSVTAVEASEGSAIVASLGGHVTSAAGWLRPILQVALCHVFQRFCLEGDKGNRELMHRVRTGAM